MGLRTPLYVLLILLLFPARLAVIAAEAQKQKRVDPAPLTPVQSTPSQQVVARANNPNQFDISDRTVITVVGTGPARKAQIGLAITVGLERPATAKLNEVWLGATYITYAYGEKPDFPLSDYSIDTTGWQVVDGEGVALERIPLSALANEILDEAASNRRTFVPSAPPPPPVGSPSTYYIDCFGGYYTNTVSCQATPDNTSAYDAYAAQQAGYLIGTAIQAWRVRHHNALIDHIAREELAIIQDHYLRDRLTFLGSTLVEPDPKPPSPFIIYRRMDGIKPLGPFTVKIDLADPGSNVDRVLTFQFVDSR
jgi:hypothetical protein